MSPSQRTLRAVVALLLRFVVVMTLLATWQRVLLGATMSDIIDHPSLLWAKAADVLKIEESP